LSRILLTGYSSFTGTWFADRLAESGHEVVVCLTKTRLDYNSEFKYKFKSPHINIKVEEKSVFGSKEFSKLISDFKPQKFCFHHAMVDGYRDPDFDVESALSNNLLNYAQVISDLVASGCTEVIMSRSIFEKGLGKTDVAGDISPYGESKRKTFEIFSKDIPPQLSVRSFVICNPVGKFEGNNLTSYLIKNWKSGQAAKLFQPKLVRDFIPIDLLSKTYAEFVDSKQTILIPSYLPISNFDYARKIGQVIHQKYQVNTPIDTSFEQYDENVPLIRIGLDKLNFLDTNQEEKFWEDFVTHLWDRLKTNDL
jgi:nucleoside-diphosphate-sugar epimerase